MQPSQNGTIIRRIVVCLTLLLILTACSNSDEDGNTTTPPIVPNPGEPLPDPGPTPPASGTVTLAWDSPSAELGQECPEVIAGYKLYTGNAPGVYTSTQTLPINDIDCIQTGQSGACGAILTCTHRIENLGAGTWHFSLTVYNSAGIESVFSNNLEYTVEQP